MGSGLIFGKWVVIASHAILCLYSTSVLVPQLYNHIRSMPLRLQIKRFSKYSNHLLPGLLPVGACGEPRRSFIWNDGTSCRLLLTSTVRKYHFPPLPASDSA